ncbi:RNA-guided endonuclease InsQ/TnpB family protein [Anoxybacteroides amylolyticum]|uniref:Transposase, IS605 OrfB family n=1 Tax=Anoxybacteroides amylolyticum TaxID=294699 RepID=A0A167TTE0_9BACL|nr:RNA-guided endonuclease TnpB family protein [Anoxybacillus amylolyticus]ANB62260.1 transposase, IS605 OrfB family [Anoxybacillus amylolyticus]
MDATRVEKYIIKPSHPYFHMLDEFCFRSKNLYNFANYHVRQLFFKDGTYLSYNKLDKLIKTEGMDADYRAMPLAQCAQQTLRMLHQNWKSFFKSMKDRAKNKEKYTGRPKPPKYVRKDGRYVLVLTNQSCKIKDNHVVFPECFQGFQLKTKIVGKLQQVRFIPKHQHIVVEVVYKISVPSGKKDNGRYISIDLGLDNFATIVNNVGAKPIAIDGKGLKSVNQYYNKQISHYRKVVKQMNRLDWTKRMSKITEKRNHIVENFMHQASRFVIKHALSLDCDTIVVGMNKDWKREVNLGKRTNQSFVHIPYQTFIHQLRYKAEQHGIRVIVTEESYTSKCSFLDMEEIKKQKQYKGTRIKRGLFQSANGMLINADVNGAYNIMRKVFPKAFANGIEGVGLHPIRVLVA